jgi:sugar phosphate isomerase/epimerase
MKLGCSSSSYRTAFLRGEMDQQEWLRLCGDDLEMDGVELVDEHFPTTDAAYLREVKRLCAAQHLVISGVAVTSDFGPGEQRPREMERVRQWVDVAAYLGAPVLRLGAGRTPLPRDWRQAGRVAGLLKRVFGDSRPNTRRLWSDVTWALSECARYAGERGVVLALRNDPEGLVAGPMQLDRALMDVGSPWLRACVDPASMPDTAGLDFVIPRAVQAHARLRDVREDGSDGGAHWPELLRLLRLARYRGFVHVDYVGGEDPRTAVPRAARYLRGVLHVLERQRLLQSPGAPSTNGSGDASADDVVEVGAAEAP